MHLMGNNLEPLSEFPYHVKLSINVLFTTSEKIHKNQEVVEEFLSSNKRLTIFMKEWSAQLFSRIKRLNSHAPAS